MGLIRAAIGAAGGVLADQWREYFYCESLPVDVLVSKGRKRTSSRGRSSNVRGEDNIISNGSIVAVNEGQFMMIVEQGKIVEFCDEPGEFVYDTSTEPSLFYGGFGQGLIESFKQFGKRFTFGGDPAKDQRVYYFNKKEIIGNRYGTPNPIPFRVVDRNIGLDVDVAVRCHGEYSYRLVDPLLFYVNVTGNVADEYRRDQIDSQLRSELMTALQPAFARISEMGIRYSALPGHTTELADALNQVLSEKWRNTRGLVIASFGISSITAPPEDEEMIKQLQRSAVMRSPEMAAANIAAAQADAMRAAAKNEGAGPVMAFAGMNMAQQAGGMNAANLFNVAQQQQQQQQQAPPPQQQAATWTCVCGAANSGRFCTQCGKPKPQGAAWRCDKCGWQPQDPNNVPRFCPNCGDPFNEQDRI